MKIKNLTQASETLKTTGKEHTKVMKQYGTVGKVCYQVSEFLKSKKGKEDIKTANTNAKAWIAENFQAGTSAFYNAVRYYKESQGMVEAKTNSPKQTPLSRLTAQIRRIGKTMSVKDLMTVRDIVAGVIADKDVERQTAKDAKSNTEKTNRNRKQGKGKRTQARA